MMHCPCALALLCQIALLSTGRSGSSFAVLIYDCRQLLAGSLFPCPPLPAWLKLSCSLDLMHSLSLSVPWQRVWPSSP